MKTGKNKRKKIIVAMSGGVDSSVSAALLKQANFDVIGVMMKFWSASPADKKEGNRCCSLESETLARLVAKKIGIPFYVINAEKEFKKKVVDYFIKEYKAGNTPNPCVVCNKEIKFGLLIDKALKMGADYIATGHYAQFINGKLLKGKDTEKDQSYFLWQLNQKQLSRVLFPVGGYTKTQVRELAKKFDLPTAETPESQEVCFVPASSAGRQDINNFLKKYLKAKPGNIVDRNNKILGKHFGLCFYTIGQRKGLEVPQGPWFVVAKDFNKNALIVSKNKKDLLSKELVASNVSWISGKQPRLPLKVKVKIRYRANFSNATIFQISNSKFQIRFSKPQQAITSGQSVVFYKGKELLGGGIIK